MRLTFSLLATAAWLSTGAALAEEHPTFQELLNTVRQKPECQPRDNPDYILVTCKGATMTQWYFTKPNHPAHPGVVKRTLVQENGQIVVHEDGTSFASNSDQPAFKAWLAQFEDLDRRMIEAIKAEQAAKPKQPAQ
jgi:hypothetical protein